MNWLTRAIRVMMRVLKLLTSAIRNIFEGLSAAASFFLQEAAAQISGLLPKTDMRAIVRQIKKSIKDLGDSARDNPYQAAFIVLCIFAIVAAPVLVSPVLAAAGFTAVGPAAGTTAAAVQSLISPVAARSTFATLQSAAMGGYGLPIVVDSFQTVGAVGLSMALWKLFRGKGGDDDDKIKVT